MKLAATHFQRPADGEALRLLREVLPSGVPPDYFKLLARHDGAEFSFEDVDWGRDGYDSIRIFSVGEMLKLRRDGSMAEEFPKLIVVGTDSGGQFLAYDTDAPAPWSLILHCPGAVAERARVAVASCLEDFLRKWGVNPVEPGTL